jgi:hypothetical protein
LYFARSIDRMVDMLTSCSAALVKGASMVNPKISKKYRDVIDELVEMCHNGQGQIGPRRARAGVWNQNATADILPDQHEINDLLSRMLATDREILAKMLAAEVVTGVFETLKVLEAFEISPFEVGYEGSPFMTSSAGWTTGNGLMINDDRCRQFWHECYRLVELELTMPESRSTSA